MGIFEKDGRYSFVKRVPKRFQHVDSRRDVRIALKTDSRTEAERKAPQVEAELIAYWEALADGRSQEAKTRYDALARIAAAQGVAYVPHSELATGPIEDIIKRLLLVRDAGGVDAPDEIIDALTGEELPPETLLSTALEDFFDLTTDRLSGKTERQVHRWRLPRIRAVKNFITAVQDKDITQINREDALLYRQWWRDKIEADDLKTDTANKDFSNIANIFQTWADLRRPGLLNPFRRIAFRTVRVEERFPFSVEWIASRLVAPGAWDDINDDASDVVMVMVNTGARPTEVINADPDHFVLDHDIPHLCVRKNLKTPQSRREIPLLGVSLAAAHRLRDRGGCTRYIDNEGSWSANVNKFMTTHGLRQTPDHSAYSLRHSFDDRLLEAGVDDRVRAELMGHKYAKRATYGSGGSLALKRDAIAKIAI